jgi:oxygen-independent coproporphyrinogen-3 oxidase
MLLLNRFSAWQSRLRHSARLANNASGAAPTANVVVAGRARGVASSPSSSLAAAATDDRSQAAADQAPYYPAPRNAYVHLPFCRRKCFYCDFPVEAIGGGGGKSNGAPPSSSSSPPDPAATSRRAADRIRAYVDLVVREIHATARLLGPERGGSRVVAPAPAAVSDELLDTVYFGGGTPSLVPPALVAEIVATLDARFGVAPGAEVTLEADPGTFDAARLREYCAPRGGGARGGGNGGGGGGGPGVTRVSVGVQAFQDALLEACGRSHSLRDVREAVAAVRAAVDDPACGLRSWSLDLICGLPGLSREAWADSLAQAVATGAGHVSVYDLQVEEGTPFARWYGDREDGGKGGGGGGKAAAGGGSAGSAPPPRPPGSSSSSSSSSSLPDEEAGTAMYAQASEALRAAGYERYELSNYALLTPDGGGGGGGAGGGAAAAATPPPPPALPSPSPHRSAHNQCYWRGVPYLAFGLGAASYVRGVRYSRPRDMRAYERWVAALEEAAAEATTGEAFASGGGGGDGPASAAADLRAPPLLWAPGLPHDARVETPRDRLLDRVMLALRTSDGLDLAALAREHGPGRAAAALPALERARAAGLAELRPSPVAAAGGSALPYDWARLTDPAGLMLSNDVISDVFALLDDDEEE